MDLISYAVKRPVVMNIMTAMVFIAGVLCYLRLPKEMFPDVELEVISVSTLYLGASPDEVDKLVTRKIESEVRTVKGIDRVESISVEGVSVINVFFQSGERVVSEALLDVRAAAGKARAKLPSEAKEPDAQSIRQEIQVLNVVLAGDVAEEVLVSEADRLEDDLYQISGVGEVEVTGRRKREVTIECDPDRLHAQGVTLAEVKARLAATSLDLPAGNIEETGEKRLLRIPGEFRLDDRDRIARTIIRPNPDGAHLLLRDFATVTIGFEEATVLSRFDGKPSITLSVRKRREADTVTVAERVKAHLAERERTLPPAVALHTFFDRSKWVQRRLSNMFQSGIVGGAIVLVLLFLFLNWRLAVLTALGVPFAFLGTLVVMAFFGISFNMISMFGMIVVLGMLVDDAIVVVENVHRHMENGVPGLEAAVRGTKEVIWPVVSSVTTTMLAFIPLIFIEGIMGKFIMYIPIVVIMALGVSLFEAMAALPAHIVQLAPAESRRDRRDRSGFRRGFDRWYGRLVSLYTYALARCVRHRYPALACLIALGVGAYFLGRGMPFVFFATEESEEINVDLEGSAGRTLEFTADVMVAQVEEAVLLDPELRDEVTGVSTRVGVWGDMHDRRVGNQYARLTLEVAHHSRRRPRVGGGKKSADWMVNRLRERLSTMPEVARFEVGKMSGGPPSSSDLAVRVRGGDVETLQAIADEVKDFLNAIPGVYEVNDDSGTRKREIRLQVDEHQAARFGLDRAQIANYFNNAIAGQTATAIQTVDEQVDVVVKVREDRRRKLSDITEAEIPRPGGGSVKFRDVGAVVEAASDASVRRYDAKRSMEVSASVDRQAGLTAQILNQRLQEKFADVPARWPGYSISFGGENEDMRKLFDSLSIGFPLALLGIFLILAAEFGSYMDPLVVMVTVPFGIVGVIIGNAVTATPLGFLAIIGAVALAGITVNDAIVMVDFIKKGQAEGCSLPLAILRAGRVRLRPIILTSVTTIGGLLPLALGMGADAEFLAPMGNAICWGLTFSTVLTLLVIPSVYMIVDDARRGLARLWGLYLREWRVALGRDPAPAPVADERSAAD
ncbi:MAG: efflux RND transporter permease subunit [Planctomycetes bacterium]|nr:efflux RND transporter permease subunit [Planctomycetota bacterium]